MSKQESAMLEEVSTIDKVHKVVEVVLEVLQTITANVLQPSS